MNASDQIGSIAIANISHSPKAISEEVVIGKDVLELLTGAMYNDPLTIYREYVQNAADAIEDAVACGLLSSMSEGRVEIWLDHTTRSIRIRDNGIGIPASEFVRRLTSVGMSGKRQQRRRGFRGVGRLSGLGYCQEVIFRSKTYDESKPRELIWNGRQLKELLRDSATSNLLGEAIKSVVTTRAIAADEYPKHFFEVELRGIVRLKNDVLLNEDVVRSYLAQIAPVSFAEAFSFGETINAFLSKHNVGQVIAIELHNGGGQIFRPHMPTLRASAHAISQASGVETFELEGMDGEIAAIGWILHHDYVGAFSSLSLVGGLRVRVGNIQIGNHNLLEQIFSEPRFNAWSVGEIHILSRKIVPNGRRDDFEANAHWHDALGKLRSFGSVLGKLCRSQSQNRLAARRGLQLFHHVQQTLSIAKTYAKLNSANELLLEDIERNFDELKKLQRRQEEGSATRATFDDWVDKLARPVAALNRATERPGVLEFLPKNQRTTFKNALELVLMLSQDPVEASELVERIISHAKKAHR